MLELRQRMEGLPTLEFGKACKDHHDNHTRVTTRHGFWHKLYADKIVNKYLAKKARIL